MGRITRTTLSVILACVGLGCLALLVHAAWHGFPSPVAIRLGKPRGLMLLGSVSLAALYLLNVPRRTRRAAVGRLALLAVSLGVALFVGELAVRASLRRTQGFGSLRMLREYEQGGPIKLRKGGSPLAHIVRLSTNRKLVYELIPNLRIDFGHRLVEVNSDSMRESREFSPVPAAGTLRVVGVGDSGMFGWGVEQGQDYLSVLESNLNARADGRAYEVLNMAVPGYSTFQEIETLRTRGLKYRPDIVVIGWSDNDFRPPFFVYKRRTFSRRDRSYLYTFAFYRDDELLKPEIMTAEEVDAELMDPELVAMTDGAGVREALQQLKTLAAEHGFHVLVFGAMGQHIVPLCEGLGIDFFNIYTEIPPRRYPKEYRITFMHPRAAGHAVLANHLEQALAGRGWLPPPAGPRAGR